MSVKSNLEYNDGVGDLLKEKETHPFSWVKTITVMTGIVLSVIASIIIAFKAGVSILKCTQRTHTTQSTPLEAPLKTVSSTPILKPETEAKPSPKMQPPAKTKSPTRTKEHPKKAKPVLVPYKVIVGEFQTPRDAQVLLSELREKKIRHFSWVDPLTKITNIQVGAFSSEKEANRYIELLKANGFSPQIIKK